MRIAAIDIGTNSVHMIVVRVRPDLSFEVIDREKAMVRLGVSPHAPYTCSLEVYAACMGLDLPVATHLNESQDELDWLLRGEGPWQPFAAMLVEPEGMSGIRSLAAAGLLDERVAAAHCVKVEPEEIGLLARHGVAVTHCPRSNALLGCGIAPLDKLRAAGLRVGVGTDGVSSVPSHDSPLPRIGID